MPLVNGLPTAIAAKWSSFAPQQAKELITTYNMDEKDALATPPGEQVLWADRGTVIAPSGGGIVKFPTNLPQSLDFSPFEAGNRKYKSFDTTVKAVEAGAYDLNFAIPMIWDTQGNGYKLMSKQGDSLVEFLGINGIGAHYAMAGRAKKAALVADLFYRSMYTSAAWGVAPSLFTYPQPNNPNGIALFTDGTGAEGSGGCKHYAHPNDPNGGRFFNLFKAYGSFATRFGASLVEMAKTPHPLFANMTNGAQVTDVIGPTYMRTAFYEMMVSDLVLTLASTGGNGVAAAVSNPYSYARSQGITEENFIGSALGPRKFWVAPHLDNHPYVLANANTNGAGRPAEMWINISAGMDPLTGKPRPSWAKGVASSVEFVPTFFMYGPGDPRAEGERRMRFEGNLDAAVEPGSPMEIQAFFQV